MFIDVGANVGLFSFFVAACAGPSARILAVEPEKGNLERFFFNMRANPGLPIRVVSAALAGEAGMLAVEPDRRDRGGTRVHKCVQGGEVTVEAKTLLQLLAQEAVESSTPSKSTLRAWRTAFYPRSSAMPRNGFGRASS